jgi:hypothetical protein
MKRLRPPVLAQQNFQKHRTELERLNLGDRLGAIFRQNIWGSPESASGVGSTIEATEAIRAGLIDICEDYSVASLLDAPCGDYGWMGSMKLPLKSYVGLDIVPELIARNQQLYQSQAVQFAIADLTQDALPNADLVLCRDCLVHLSFANIQRVLANFRRSGASYLLTTTFPEHDQNTDIEDGDWRPLNLQTAPFHFPEPLRVINERCEEIDGAYDDKSLALWRLADLPLS